MKFQRQKDKAKTPSFVTEIPLRVNPHIEEELSIGLDAGRQIYNACLGETMRKMRLVKQSKHYQQARKRQINAPLRKQLFKQARDIYQYNEYATYVKGQAGKMPALHMVL